MEVIRKSHDAETSGFQHPADFAHGVQQNLVITKMLDHMAHVDQIDGMRSDGEWGNEGTENADRELFAPACHDRAGFDSDIAERGADGIRQVQEEIAAAQADFQAGMDFVPIDMT